MSNTEGNRSNARALVLCVGLGEDERILLREYQSKAGSNVTFFESTPDKAVRILEETLFDCVLSGVNRGIESARKKTPYELYGEACPLLRMFENRTGASNVCMRFDADGRKHYVEESAYPIHDAEGEIVRAILFVRDATEREMSEQRLLGHL